jgi:hypothetical protein
MHAYDIPPVGADAASFAATAYAAAAGDRI